MPGFAFPAVGPLGLSSPPSQTGSAPALRYYAQLRLPKAHLGFLRFSLSSSDTLYHYKETVGSLEFPSLPFELMPCSQTPVVSPTLATYRIEDCCLTAPEGRRLSLPVLLCALGFAIPCFRVSPCVGLTRRIP